MTKAKWSLRMEDVLGAIGDAKEVISCIELGKVLKCSRWAVGSRLTTLRMEGRVRRIYRGNTWYYYLPEEEGKMLADLEAQEAATDDVEAWLEDRGLGTAVRRLKQNGKPNRKRGEGYRERKGPEGFSGNVPAVDEGGLVHPHIGGLSPGNLAG